MHSEGEKIKNKNERRPFEEVVKCPTYRVSSTDHTVHDMQEMKISVVGAVSYNCRVIEISLNDRSHN